MRSINLIAQIILGILLPILLNGCAGSQSKDEAYSINDILATDPDRPPNGQRNDGSKLYQDAELFDRYVRGKLSPEQVSQLRENCKKDPKSNAFCFSVRRSRLLTQYVESKNKIRHPIESKPLIPLAPEMTAKGVSNWKTLRKGNVQALLKGLLATNKNDLQILVHQALKETRCPNNIAVALAATLEDYLPDQVNTDEIAELYYLGGRCARDNPADREHFYTRAALLHVIKRHYSRAAEILAKVHPVDAYSGRALYWLFRVRTELGDQKGAAQAFKRLMSQHPFSFHALAASKSLGEDFGQDYLGERPLEKKHSARSPGSNAMITQIETLHKYGFDYTTAILVDWALDQYSKMESEVRLYLASMGDPEAKISTTAEIMLRRSMLTRQVMELAYPKAFFSLFLKHSSSNVPPFLGLSVSRKESAFNPRAVSPANAQGLLQMNPDTAAKMSSGATLNLMDPDINVEYGMRYLGDLIQKMNGQIYLALACYNAGDEPVYGWQKRFPGLEPLLFVDLIPYRETRDYVGFVLNNYYWYRRIYEGPLSVKEIVP